MLVPLTESQSSAELPVTITVAPPPCRLAGRLSGGRQGGHRAPTAPARSAIALTGPEANGLECPVHAVDPSQRRDDGRWLRPLVAVGGLGRSRDSVERALIGAWAVRHGCRVRCVFQEPTSGGIDSPRSMLRQVLERVESRESDGMVVARITSLSRSLEEAVSAVERIEAAGGRFVSVCDGIDLGTASGRLVLRVLLSVLEW